MADKKLRTPALVHLLQIMEDQTSPTDLRIEAAKQILLHCQRVVAEHEQG